ncbi:hypothetical protein [Flavobacterium panici]|nr:hypothetical protein [Flavobacterium panici]
MKIKTMKKISLITLMICLSFTACDSDSEIKLQDSLNTQKKESLKNEDSTQDEDSKNLEKLYDEIIALSDSNSACSGEWDFIAIGKKPCGGPEKYIPYSLKIDRSEFLAKVNSYAIQQEIFNTKWNITSTCDVARRPLAAVCVDGKATLLYEEDRNIEKQDLQKLHDEIIALSTNNASCFGDWDYTAIGSKPCGGPEKYIPYYVNIDRTDFFNKVNIYKAKQMEFNHKWKVNSTCDVVAEPVSATCINGKGNLLYEAERTKEEQDLEKLYNEIIALSDINKPCTGDWDFTAIGSKACGGPEKYIPYSLKINTTDFLAKVNYYSIMQESFNHKWKVISFCDIPNRPKSVECVNGKATLMYN